MQKNWIYDLQDLFERYGSTVKTFELTMQKTIYT